MPRRFGGRSSPTTRSTTLQEFEVWREYREDSGESFAERASVSRFRALVVLVGDEAEVAVWV